MSTDKKPSAKTEIVVAGQPSAGLLAHLKTLAAQVSDEQVGQCYYRVESARRKFAADVIRLGVLLLAKKQAIAHGRWADWVAQMTTSADPAVLTLPPSVREKSARSVRVYMQVAKHFLADLEQENFQPEAEETVTGPACRPEEIVLFSHLPPERKNVVDTAIESFVGGRSLERMLMDFGRAERAADQEQAADNEAKARRKTKNKDDAQMDFWDEMNLPLGTISTLLKNKHFIVGTTKRFWSDVADRLLAQSKEARALAAKIAE